MEEAVIEVEKNSSVRYTVATAAAAAAAEAAAEVTLWKGVRPLIQHLLSALSVR